MTVTVIGTEQTAEQLLFEQLWSTEQGRALLGILADDPGPIGADGCRACRGAGCPTCDFQTIPLPSLAGLPMPELQLGSDPSVLRDEILWEVRQAIDNDPRSVQTSIGPSELGIECDRRLAHMLAGTTEVNFRSAPWKPNVGKAVHAWLEDVFRHANRRYDVVRYLVETRVEVGELTIGGRLRPIRGSSDFYDRITATVVDWKIVGPSTLDKIRTSKKPSMQYRRQGHLYGRGYMRRGLYVERVAIFYFPREGELTDAYYWNEPYDEKIALETLERAQATQAVVEAAGPAAPGLLPTSPAYCTFCPYYQAGATDLTTACPGDPRRNRAYIPAGTKRSSFDGII